MTALVITNIVCMALISAAIVGLLAKSVLISARDQTVTRARQDMVRPATRRVTRRRAARTHSFGTSEGLKV